MSIDRKKIRTDIPGHHAYAGSQNAEDARRLVIGRDIVLQGAVSACDHLQVEGVIEAPTFACRRLEIMETGVFAGVAEAHDAVIAGRFEGRLIVHGRLSVKSTGMVFGEVHYGSLDVEAGARIEAQVAAMTQPAEPAVQPEAPAIAAAAVSAANVSANVAPFPATAADDSDDEDDGETTKERAGLFRRAVGF